MHDDIRRKVAEEREHACFIDISAHEAVPRVSGDTCERIEIACIGELVDDKNVVTGHG
jgi:hypothetical protein